MYLFYLWSKMARALLEAVETIGRANLRVVDAGDRLSEQVANFLDKATDVAEKLATQFTQEFNPLLHEVDGEQDNEGEPHARRGCFQDNDHDEN